MLPILNPKPRDTVPDLRLVHPFPALTALCDRIHCSTLELHQHAHVPYPLVLLKLANEWKGAHNGTLPATFTEKQEFAATIKAASRDFDTELNFQEAVRNAYTAYTPRTVDADHLATLFDATATAAASTTESSTQRFHCLLQALYEFLQRHNQQPPVNGSIPDMTASTDWYVQLQTVYREQAASDVAELKALFATTASGKVGGATQRGGDNDTDDLVATFCQNVGHLSVLQTGNSLADQTDASLSDDVCQELSAILAESDDERPEQLSMLWYLGFVACQLFCSRYGRYPGTTTTTTTITRKT